MHQNSPDVIDAYRLTRYCREEENQAQHTIPERCGEVAKTMNTRPSIPDLHFEGENWRTS